MPRSLGLSPAPLSILRLLSLLLLLILSVALPEENPPQLAILAPPIGGGPTDEKGDLEVVVRMGVPVSEGGHLLGISLASYVAVFQGEGAPLIGNLTLRAAQVKIVEEDPDGGGRRFEVRFSIPADQVRMAGEEKAHFSGWATLDVALLCPGEGAVALHLHCPRAAASQGVQEGRAAGDPRWEVPEGLHHVSFLSNWPLRQADSAHAHEVPDVYILPPHFVAPMGDGTHFTHFLGDVILPLWTSPLWAALTTCPSRCVQVVSIPPSSPSRGDGAPLASNSAGGGEGGGAGQEEGGAVPAGGWAAPGSCFAHAVVGNALEPRGWHIVSFPSLWRAFGARLRAALSLSPLLSLPPVCFPADGSARGGGRGPVLLLLRREKRDVANSQQLLAWANATAVRQ
ncbi:hypothetical protein T484DRAFT_1833446 [Baffinella frigidus]|nr:hypothetical protein T484DRAFT_1833446 [Cryptophyta sp. CCMP2293]